MSKSFKRVMLIGNAGTGKSTFARKLASLTDLPLIHLDKLFHDSSENWLLPEYKDEWSNLMRKLAREDTWIMDGNYSTTFPERFKRADIIFYFDFPTHKSLMGVLHRRVHYNKKKRPDMPDDWEEKLNLEFIKMVWNFKKKYIPKLEKALTPAARKKFVIFKNRAQADEYLRSLESQTKSVQDSKERTCQI